MEKDEITSIRIVSADHYMSFPIDELDPIYSQFRGSQVKQVPIIRIFGSDSKSGRKVCLHVHGVFPYMYIPFDDEPEAAEKITYQLSASLDKAINISLGQSTATTQHVFKVILVKGIPFYGYHSTDHTFLKIYFYNPYFIKRAASLFQNGAILGKVFQSYEIHVPYILQFFIDYNLYGMSFLHIPAKIIRYRQDENDSLLFVNSSQLLDRKITKVSVSEMEFDIVATYILNRLMTQNKSEHINPGIASIWEDERVRRKKIGSQMNPVELSSLSQSRTDVNVTESDLFYRDALSSKLNKTNINETILDTTLITTNENLSEQNNRFNSSTILNNSVYPAEFSQNTKPHFINASFIENHCSTTTIRNGFRENTQTDQNESIIDEELILSLTASNNRELDSSLTTEDYELLEVMRLLEENEQLSVDNDSLLAPLTQTKTFNSQTSNLSQSQRIINKSVLNVVDVENKSPNKTIVNVTEENFGLSDSDDDLLNDLTIPLSNENNSDKSSDQNLVSCDADDVWQNSLFWNNVQLPQFDGANDIIKSPRKTYKRLCKRSERRSPKKISKYDQLDINITTKMRRPKVILSDIEDVPFENFTDRNVTKKNNNLNKNIVDIKNFVPLKCQVHIKKMNFENIEVSNIELMMCHDNVTSYDALVKQSEKNNDDVPMLLTPKKQHHHDVQMLTPKNDHQCNGSEMMMVTPKTQIMVTPKKQQHEQQQQHSQLNLTPQQKIVIERSPLVKVLKLDENDVVHLRDVEKIRNKTPSPPTQQKPQERKGSPSDVARRYDQRNNFYPEPGPSTINYYQNIIIPGYNQPLTKSPSPTPSPQPQSQSSNLNQTIDLNTIDSIDHTPINNNNNNNNQINGETIEDISILLDSDSEELDNPIESFYDKSIISDSPVQLTPTSRQSPVSYQLIKVTSIKLPPTYEFVKNSMAKLNIPENIYPVPFYSDPKDVTKRKEIGNTILQINDKSINNLENFRSLLNNKNNLDEFRKNIIVNMLDLDPNIINDQIENIIPKDPKKICEFLTTQDPVQIYPHIKPPTKSDAQKWLFKKQEQEKKTSSQIQKKEKKTSSNDVIEKKSTSTNTKIKRKIKEIETIILDSCDDGDDWDVQDVVSDDDDVVVLDEFDEKEVNSDSDDLTYYSYDEGLWEILPNPLPKHQSSSSSSSSSSSIVPKKINKTINDLKSSRKKSKFQSPTSRKYSFVDNDRKSRLKLTKHFNEINNSRESLSRENSKNKKINDIIVDDKYYDLDKTSELSGASLNNTFGFKMDLENYQTANANTDFNYLTILSIEIHVKTRCDLKPDPDIDPVSAIFFAVQNNVPEIHKLPSNAMGIFMLKLKEDNHLLNDNGVGDVNVKNECGDFMKNITIETDIKYVTSEKDLFIKLYELVKYWDPDIFLGYEVEMGSWGYLIQRGYVIEMNLPAMLSRIPMAKIDMSKKNINGGDEVEESSDYGAELTIPGRILMDVWRLLRHEIALTSYTFENCMYHILHRRCVLHSFKELTHLSNHTKTQWIVLEYYLERTKGSLELLDQLDLIGRTCELAKLFGIQFFEVLSRGSQFRVESMMLRMAKPRNFIPVSPSVQQRAKMRAPEYLPLILEPHSRFYVDPLIVLDFQSLYPSMMIAYNYCYSTCLGRVDHLGQSQPFEFGASQLKVPTKIIEKLLKRNLITISPCGAVFVKSEVREGTLPRMLKEILDTRIMVKQSMKLHKDNRLLQRVLHSRQLGLKLIANVTYGYTAANFSGRMPCVEVGDSILSKARETLERAIKIVENNTEWNAKVVYGDTDSLFVLVPGRSRDDAFRIGAEIALAVTNDNPKPVKLKLEKVYHPSILQTKKRYVGYMFETPDQKEPIYEAKGIETVRRDGCPAVPKILEKTIRILFDSRDVSLVKRYLCRQFTKVLNGKVNLKDLIFAKEFRGINGYKPGACVPSLELTRKWLKLDKRAIPRRGERVPYLIANGPPGLPLIRLVRSPHEILKDDGLKINSMYYVTKVLVPPINRCLLLIGVDVNEWIADLPRKIQKQNPSNSLFPLINNNNSSNIKKSTISQYFATTNCIVDCGRQTQNGICPDCLNDKQKTSIILNEKISNIDRKYSLITKICQSCCGRQTNINCISLDCPVLFKLNKTMREHNHIPYIIEILNQYFK